MDVGRKILIIQLPKEKKSDHLDGTGPVLLLGIQVETIEEWKLPKRAF